MSALTKCRFQDWIYRVKQLAVSGERGLLYNANQLMGGGGDRIGSFKCVFQIRDKMRK